MRRNIRAVLERWGAWTAAGKPGPREQDTSPGFELMTPRSTARISCCDDDALKVDHAVGALQRVGRADELRVIKGIYIDQETYRRLGEALKISVSQVQALRSTAEGFIEAYLMATGVKLEMDMEVSFENSCVHTETMLGYV